MKNLAIQDVVERKICLIRGRKVILDKDLAVLYGVETRVLNQAVKRNKCRFPEDFMFSLTREEIMRMSQAVTSLKFYKSVNAFTEQGVAMLSSVLNSERAIKVNIAIMRAFVRVGEILLEHKDLAAKIATLEFKYKNHDMRFSEYDKRIMAIFDAIKKLMAPPLEKPRRIIGFKQE